MEPGYFTRYLGIRAIVAPSFGDNFASNCAKNGMVTVPIADVAPLIGDAVVARPLTIDLIDCTVIRSNGGKTVFAIDAGVRDALLHGWDEVATILGRHGKAITDFEMRQASAQPWFWSNG